MNFLKFLPLIMKFKDVADAYREETGKDKPFYMSRRFIGAVLVVLAGVLAAATGVDLGPEMLDTATGAVTAAITAGVALYGAVLGIVGAIKKQPSSGGQGGFVELGILAIALTAFFVAHEIAHYARGNVDAEPPIVIVEK